MTDYAIQKALNVIAGTDALAEQGAANAAIGRIDLMQSGGQGFMPTGAIAQTFPRMGPTAGNQGVLASGRLHLTAVWLPAGATVSSITYVSATTAANTPTNQWFALYNEDLTLIGQTDDDTTTAWASNTAKTLNFATPVVTTAQGFHYVGICVAATSVPTLTGVGTTNLHSIAPITNGSSTTGLTTTAPATAAALTQQTVTPYAYLS